MVACGDAFTLAVGAGSNIKSSHDLLTVPLVSDFNYVSETYWFVFCGNIGLQASMQSTYITYVLVVYFY